ncbi:MAG: ATP-binding protein [Pseudomonadota bacterium]
MQPAVSRRLLEEILRGQQLLDLVPSVLVAVDARGRVEWMNRTGYLLTGKQESEVVGLVAAEVLVDEKHRTNSHRFFEAGDHVVDRFEEFAVTLNQRQMLWHTKQREDSQGTFAGFLCVGEDVTESTHIRAQLAQNDRLATVGMLAAGVAHEINNPLTSILFNLIMVNEDLPRLLEMVEVLRRQLLEMAGAEVVEELLRPYQRTIGVDPVLEIKASLDDATLGAERVRDIVRDLKVFSRVEEDKLALVDIRGPIETAISMGYHEIKYRAKLVKDLPLVPLVLANDGRLAQVFLNLLVNAAQAIQEGDAQNQQIVIRTRARDGLVEVSVTDTGKGIAPEHLGKVFDPFFTTKPSGIGSGLGLSICRSIVEGLGGEISVRSEAGQGTSFVIRLPEGRTAAASVAPAARDVVRPVARSRILVVDDDPLMRSVIQRLLGPVHDVVTVDSGQAAIDLLERDSDFGVVLCDVMMPSVTGVDVFERITRKHPSLVNRFLFMTGGIFTPHTRESLQLIQRPTIEKPFQAQKLRELIAAVLQGEAGVKP